jgi:hypothetical protein
MKYLILIGDIVESKKIPQRKKFQTEFQKLIQNINAEHRDKIVSPLTITLGDEFQGLLKDPKDLFVIIHHIQSSFQRITFRFALSVGNISTNINRETAIGMDGSGFHDARAAMDQNKKGSQHFSYFGPQPESVLINNMLRWIDQTTVKWKKEKWKTLLLNQLGKSQKEIEQQIKISQSAISQNLKNPMTVLVLETEKIIEQYLLKLIKK